jgi:uncharacterized phage-associated protein
MIYTIAEALLTFDSMSQDRLQKLCYFAYAWYLTFFGERLFEERFEAWEDGPVCPELFEKYEDYNRMPIPKSKQELEQVIPKADLHEFLRAIYDAHGSLKAVELHQLACSEEPWRLALKRQEEGEDPAYSDEEIISWNTKKVLQELHRENMCLVYDI